jgi:hypothetical protein
MGDERHSANTTEPGAGARRLARAEAAQAALLVRLWDAQRARRAAEAARLAARLLAMGARIRALGGQAPASPAAFLPPLRRARKPRRDDAPEHAPPHGP